MKTLNDSLLQIAKNIELQQRLLAKNAYDFACVYGDVELLELLRQRRLNKYTTSRGWRAENR